MQIQANSLCENQRKKFATALLVFWILGFALAFWVGLGWLMLFQTIQSAVFTFTPLYHLVIRLLLGKDVEVEERSRLNATGNNSIMSKRLIVRTALSAIFTVLFFWKINIPIIQFLRMILK
jgi:hypothetical protein